MFIILRHRIDSIILLLIGLSFTSNQKQGNRISRPNYWLKTILEYSYQYNVISKTSLRIGSLQQMSKRFYLFTLK